MVANGPLLLTHLGIAGRAGSSHAEVCCVITSVGADACVASIAVIATERRQRRPFLEHRIVAEPDLTPRALGAEASAEAAGLGPASNERSELLRDPEDSQWKPTGRCEIRGHG